MPQDSQDFELPQRFVADLHIHSRFSMATSKQLDIPYLAAWALRKGIDVLGTGDFTHPKWRDELRQNLEYDEESGLYRQKLKNAGPAPREPFFCLQAEISSIYRRGGKVRKVHNLIFAPSLEVADEISRRLALVGNINSDGRPILGIDSHDLLELILDCSPQCVLVPAHIWTPWFSLFGSKSGFDSVEECYGDLTGHIFAMETGLSSDPPMNRCWSALDRYAMISNSDAHSGPNLGREANLFCGRPSYTGMFAALRAAAARRPDCGPCGFLGTLEFYPEEGKYHLDGHRACKVVLDPLESRKLGNICPVCGKPLTIGVLHRVMELADRTEPATLAREPEARMLVPLPEVLAQMLKTGVNSRKVEQKCAEAIAALGAELDILCDLPVEQIRAWWEPLGEAIARVRSGNVHVQPGFDGEYGRIRIFSPSELSDLLPGANKFVKLPGLSGAEAPAPKAERKLRSLAAPRPQGATTYEYTPEQTHALHAEAAPIFVMAGPGAGKTRVLTGRIQYLLDSGLDPQNLLAITFTRRAAAEMRQRLELARGPLLTMPRCDTLHALAWELFHASQAMAHESEAQPDWVLLGEEAARKLFYKANATTPKNNLDDGGNSAWDTVCLLREKCLPLPQDLALALRRYNDLKAKQKLLDYTDLLEWLLQEAPNFRGRWEHVLVDEAQDLSPLQLAIIRALMPADGRGFFGIGDPDQSIYEFRGAAGQITANLRAIWDNLQVLHLGQSFRASQKILDMAASVLGDSAIGSHMSAVKKNAANLVLFKAVDEKQEAAWIADRIRRLIGATAHSLMDGAKSDCVLSPGDIAVLVRLKAQIPPIAAALAAAGIPCNAPMREPFWHDAQCLAFMENALRDQTSDKPDLYLEKNKKLHPAYELLASRQVFSKLRVFWKQCGDWPAFFEKIAWLREDELVSAKAEKVQLLTLHASKGLEFEAVFIPGLENGILPLDRATLLGDSKLCAGRCVDYSAEQRLLYVGITRAAGSVYASYCGQRHLYGKKLRHAPSPFLPLLAEYCLASHAGRKLKQGTLL